MTENFVAGAWLDHAAPVALPTSTGPAWSVGRYQVFDEIASGGMGVVHLGRLVGEGGFSRLVALKRLHADLALDQGLVTALSEEARLAARIRHPNVASTLDVVEDSREVMLVMEYLEGETLYRLSRSSLDRGLRLAPSVLVAIVTGALLGLHAAHEARSERGEPLGLVHRDVSPQNILVGADGIARVLDFGVAKAASRTTVTARGAAKGKLTYMAPEQARGLPVDRRADLFAAGIILWEQLTGERLFAADDPATTLARVLSAPIAPPSARAPGVPPSLDAVVLCALERDPDRRFASAEQMAHALEDAFPPATQRQVAAWVQALAGPSLALWRGRCARIEALPLPSSMLLPEPSPLRDVPPIAAVEPPPLALSPSEPPPVEPSPLPEPSPRSSEPPPPSRRGALLLPLALALAGGAVVLARRPSEPPAASLPAAPPPPAASLPAPPSASAAAPQASASAAPAASASAAHSPATPRSSKPQRKKHR